MTATPSTKPVFEKEEAEGVDLEKVLVRNDDTTPGIGLDAYVPGGPGDDDLFGTANADTIEGFGGEDTMYGYGGDDTFRYANGEDALDGEILYGGAGTDKVQVTGAGVYDFREFDVDSIEEIEFAADGANVDNFIYLGTIEMDQSGELPSNLSIDGNANTGADNTLRIYLNSPLTDDIDLSGWVFQDWNTFGGDTDSISIYGDEAANTIIGTSQNEDDGIYGYGGNDSIDGGAGSDFIYGGDDNDVLNGGAGGDDTVYGGAGDDTVYWGPPSPAVSDNRRHEGDGGTDTIHGGGTFFGAVTFDLGAGTYDSGAGFTEAWVEFENYFNDGAGSERIIGTSGSNTITTGSGNNTILSGLGADTIYGGGGDDVIEGGFVTDDVYGGNGDDLFRVQDGEFYDNTYGGGGTDTLDHSAANRSGTTFDFLTDTITGAGINPASADLQSIEVYLDSAGSNTIVSSGSSDSYTLNAGDDTFIASSGGETAYGGAGTDTLDLSVGDFIYTLDLDTGVPVQYPAELFLGFENVITGAADDSITGTGAGNDIELGLGDDSADGKAGDDTVLGDAGADRLQGSNGNDVLFGGAGADLVRGGFDEDTVFGGAGDDLVSGNRGDDVVHGDAGNDVIRGVKGFDIMYGGTGDDLLKAGGGKDTIFGGDGDDKVKAGVWDDLIIDGAGFDRLRGGDGADTFDLDVDGSLDKILDWEDGLDLLKLDGFAFTDLTISDLKPGKVLIEYGSDEVKVQDGLGLLTAADFSAADFV